MASEGTSTSSDKERMEACQSAVNILAQGKRNMVCGEIPTAVNQFQEACQILSKAYGETAKECADAYFCYGQALLDLARMENGVLGNALQGVPDTDEESTEQKDEQFEKVEIKAPEREKLRKEVYDAMGEKEEEKKERLLKEAEKRLNSGETIEVAMDAEEQEKEDKKEIAETDEKDEQAEAENTVKSNAEKDKNENKMDKKSDIKDDETEKAGDEAQSKIEDKPKSDEKKSEDMEMEDQTETKNSDEQVSKDTEMKDEDTKADVKEPKGSPKSDKKSEDVEMDDQEDTKKDPPKSDEKKSDHVTMTDQKETKLVDEKAPTSCPDKKKSEDLEMEDSKKDSSKSDEKDPMEPKKDSSKTREKDPMEPKKDSSKTPEKDPKEPKKDSSKSDEKDPKEPKKDSPKSCSDKKNSEDVEMTDLKESKKDEEEGSPEGEGTEEEGEGTEEEGEGTEGEGTEEGEAAEGEGEAAEGEETTSQDGSQDGDDVSNLQLAWEMLELAKLIYLKDDSKGAKLRAAESHLKLGEVSLETEQYEEAVKDLNKCLDLQKELLESDNRSLAETHYQLGLAFCFNKQFKESTESYHAAIKVMEDRIANLDNILEKATEEEKDSKDFDTPVYKAKKEVTELREILPDIKAKIEDVDDEKKNLDDLKNLAKEAMGCLSSISAGPSTTIEAAPAQAAPNDEVKTSDISHLIKRKRKSEDRDDESAKKVKQEVGDAGDAKTICTGDAKVNGTTEKETPPEPMETKS